MQGTLLANEAPSDMKKPRTGIGIRRLKQTPERRADDRDTTTRRGGKRIRCKRSVVGERSHRGKPYEIKTPHRGGEGV